MSVIHMEHRTVENVVVAVIWLNRPERLNTINREMLDALRAQFTELERDEQVRVVILTGTGERAFSAGADVTQFPSMTPMEAEALMEYGQVVFQQIDECPKPVIAAVNGYALGGGLELALACDFRIVAQNAKLGQPEITLANLPGWGGTQRLPRIIGEPLAKELILTGRVVEAPEALTFHLAHQICEAGVVLEAALRFAGQLVQYAPTALALAKRAIHATRTGDEGYVIERQAVGLCFTTQEQHVAVDNFLQKRKKAST
jgi:enoyl-CoA hydratase/carnithine racemase